MARTASLSSMSVEALLKLRFLRTDSWVGPLGVGSAGSGAR
jgi:hypothetical protein